MIPRLFTEWPGEKIGTVVELIFDHNHHNHTDPNHNEQKGGPLECKFRATDYRACLKEPVRHTYFGYWESFVERIYDDSDHLLVNNNNNNNTDNTDNNNASSDKRSRLLELQRCVNPTLSLIPAGDSFEIIKLMNKLSTRCSISMKARSQSQLNSEETIPESCIIDPLPFTHNSSSSSSGGGGSSSSGGGSGGGSSSSSSTSSGSSSNSTIARKRKEKSLSELSFALSRLLVGPLRPFMVKAMDGNQSNCDRLYYKLLTCKTASERIGILGDIFQRLHEKAIVQHHHHHQ